MFLVPQNNLQMLFFLQYIENRIKGSLFKPSIHTQTVWPLYESSVATPWHVALDLIEKNKKGCGRIKTFAVLPCMTH